MAYFVEVFFTLNYFMFWGLFIIAAICIMRIVKYSIAFALIALYMVRDSYSILIIITSLAIFLFHLYK